MKRAMLSTLLLIFVLAYVILFFYSSVKSDDQSERFLINDVTRLYPTQVKEIRTENETQQLVDIVSEAYENSLKLSIAGSQHSQGGHTYYKDGIVLMMKEYDEILSLDRENKIIRVQSGATWEDVQAYINPYNLSVQSMQSSNIFTIGGTLSANAHGRDTEKTSVIETVRSFTLLLANGTIVNVSRTENPDLFGLVIGGYGLYGIILDAEIELTDDVVYKRKSVTIDYKDFPDYFNNNVRNNPDVKLFFVRPSIDPDALFEELVIQTWEPANETLPGIFDLTPEENVVRDKFFFGLSRKYDWAKKLRWDLQKKIVLEGEKLQSRNNAMRPPEAPLEFLEYKSSHDTDIIQEYYIPTENFITFVEEFKKILEEDRVNILSFTIRYVKSNNETYLSYAPDKDAFAIIFYANIELSGKEREHAKKSMRKIVDAAIRNNGTYYLTYNLFPTQEQIRSAYPNIDLAFEKKREYDPKEVFMNKFYEKYALGVNDDI